MVKNDLNIDLKAPQLGRYNLWRTDYDRWKYPDAYTPKLKEIIPKQASDWGMINSIVKGKTSYGVVDLQIDGIHFVVVWGRSQNNEDFVTYVTKYVG